MATVSTIEGIGPRNRKKLDDAGIRRGERLLEVGCTTKGRTALDPVVTH